MAALESGKPARSVELSDDEADLIKDLSLLTKKSIIYAANVAEDDFANGIENNAYVNRLKEMAAAEGAEVLPISARIEEELIKASYKLLGLISYLTAGEPEVRAWTIKNGTKAPQAAGKIHTDFERGFIRAEVIAYDTLIENGSIAAAKEKGLVRLEGKEYVMNDGDVVLFRFNV